LTTSPNIGLTLASSTNGAKNIYNWIDEISGEASTSNMMILDTEVGTVKSNITTLTNNMPTTTSDLTNDSSFVADASYVHTDANYTTAEKTRLAGMATGANNYTHPSTHPSSMITGLPTSLPANGGNAATVGGFTVGVNVPANAVFTDTTYPTATTNTNGLMSATDKTRLDGIATGANNYIHPSTHSADIIVDGTTNKVYTNTEKTNLANLLSTKTTTITTTWAGSVAPYTQTITVSGVTSNDKPVISPIYSTTNATAILEKTAWNLISKIETGANSITVTCFEKKPVTAINIQIKGV